MMKKSQISTISHCSTRTVQAIICPVCRDQQPLNATQHRQATTAAFTADMGKSIPSPTQAEPQVIGSVEGGVFDRPDFLIDFWNPEIRWRRRQQQRKCLKQHHFIKAQKLIVGRSIVTKCLKPWLVSFVISRYSTLTAQSLMDPTDYVHDDDDDGFAKKWCRGSSWCLTMFFSWSALIWCHGVEIHDRPEVVGRRLSSVCIFPCRLAGTRAGQCNWVPCRQAQRQQINSSQSICNLNRVSFFVGGKFRHHASFLWRHHVLEHRSLPFQQNRWKWLKAACPVEH